MAFYIVAAITVGGGLLSGKIQSNRGQKGPIGSGTAPVLEPGAPLEIAPVQGSEVLDFGAATEGFAKPKIDRSEQERQLMEDIKAAGYDPEELGIAGLAFGGPLYRKYGGEVPDWAKGIAGLGQDDPLNFQKGDLAQQWLEQHMAELFDPTKAKEQVDAQSFDEYLNTSLDDSIDINDQAPVEDPTFRARMGEWWKGQDPMVQSAIVNAGTDLIGEMFKKPARGSLVSTQTLPGNSARRRAAQINIKPIQGSVRNAAHGGVLDRQMFAKNYMPYGGKITGPGGPKDDLIPVMASNGEYMLSKAAVDAAGDGSHAMGIAKLNRFNQMGNKRYG